MSKYISQEMVKALGAGLLYFPVTHFKPSGRVFGEADNRRSLQRLSSFQASGLFAGSGTLIVIDKGSAAQANSSRDVLGLASYQALFEQGLPEALTDGNPPDIWRHTVGALSKG